MNRTTRVPLLVLSVFLLSIALSSCGETELTDETQLETSRPSRVEGDLVGHTCVPEPAPSVSASSAAALLAAIAGDSDNFEAIYSGPSLSVFVIDNSAGPARHRLLIAREADGEWGVELLAQCSGI